MPQFPATIELADLDGNNGFQINGEDARRLSGWSVAGGGDINGDGFDDLLVSARQSSQLGYGTSSVYAVFGKANGFDPAIELSELNGSNGFRIDSAATSTALTAAIAGDINGDGFADIVMGSTNYRANGPGSGAAYVVYGKQDGFAATLEIASLTSAGGFRINGEAANDNAGCAVSAAGDVNGDGIDDLLIGAQGADLGGEDRGAAYLIFGRSSGFAGNLELSSLDGNNGFQISGATDNGLVGGCVSNAGDLNHDGFDDFIIGNWYKYSSLNTAYVIFGNSSGHSAILNVSNLQTSGLSIQGLHQFDVFGAAVSSAGDINGDGFNDIVIGAPFAGLYGECFVLFGSARGISGTPGALDGSNGFRIEGEFVNDFVGFNISEAGDFNGDGFDDLLIGARSDSYGRSGGTTYVVFGKASGFDPTLKLSQIDGSNGCRISGEFDGDASGSAVSAAGDINGDGFADLLIGAKGADPNGASTGASYVVFGRASAAIDRAGTDASDKLSGGEWDDAFKGLGGNDAIRAGAGNDYVDGGSGDDYLELGAGHDNVIVSSGGNDEMCAGAGIDTIDFRLLGMSAIALDMSGCIAVLANGDIMSFCDFERARGTKGNDTILGDDRNNSLLEGNKGNDIIDGRGGADFIAGNGGKDVLTGGEGADRFDFNLVSDSGTSAASRDVITDFKRGGADRIDLATIDAIDGGGAPNDTFAFVTGGFTAAGQVRAVQSGGDTIIEVNTSDASGTEMSILLKGVIATSVMAADFLL